MPAVATLYTQLRDTGLSEPWENVQFLVDTVGAALMINFREEQDWEALSGPWNSRAVVHQATGMIMAQLHCAPRDALAMLRAHAYALETDSYATAAQVSTGASTSLNSRPKVE